MQDDKTALCACLLGGLLSKASAQTVPAATSDSEIAAFGAGFGNGDPCTDRFNACFNLEYQAANGKIGQLHARIDSRAHPPPKRID